MYPKLIVYCPHNSAGRLVGTGMFRDSGGFFAVVDSKNVIPGTDINSPYLGIRVGADDVDPRIVPIIYSLETDDYKDGFHAVALFARVQDGTNPTLLNDFVSYLNFELARTCDGRNQDYLAEFWVWQNWKRIFPHNGTAFLMGPDGGYPIQPDMPSLVKAMIPTGFMDDNDEQGVGTIYKVKVPSPVRGEL